MTPSDMASREEVPTRDARSAAAAASLDHITMCMGFLALQQAWEEKGRGLITSRTLSMADLNA